MELDQDEVKDIQNTQILNYRKLPYSPFDFQDALQQHDKLDKLQEDQFINNIQDTNPQLILACHTRQYTVDKGGAEVGKYNHCLIQLKEDSISRQHCKIIYKKYSNNFYIQDLGSKSGTFLRIKERAELIKENGIFEIGFNEIQITKIEFKDNNTKANITLRIIEGSSELRGKEKQIYLHLNKPFIIGGDKNSNMQIEGDKHIDGNHVKILLNAQNQISIEDLNTKYGTWMRLSPSKQVSQLFQLNEKDQIKLNPLIFTCHVKNTSVESAFNNIQKCLICKSDNNIYQLKPCGHRILCDNCYKQYRQCPLKSCQFIQITQKIATF
ncbi:SMAD/FHA domain [Pseudocohnilembus persalinus]|uniref:SMAD/FHA domain n=1 Tax=Pseudocohnilembus persalinus TaxID=266149 RepID=A0A0V0QDF9_PSEPJ|nr:SMAD/FHA domain [Pseudocohnilembus persalinus]|eukprot:KRX00243.1 SMAD/FHA domain [Pseudocohnilembus persalinus]